MIGKTKRTCPRVRQSIGRVVDRWALGENGSKLVNQMRPRSDILDTKTKLLPLSSFRFKCSSVDWSDGYNIVLSSISWGALEKYTHTSVPFPGVVLVGTLIVCFPKTRWRELAIEVAGRFRCGSECTCVPNNYLPSSSAWRCRQRHWSRSAFTASRAVLLPISARGPVVLDC